MGRYVDKTQFRMEYNSNKTKYVLPRQIVTPKWRSEHKLIINKIELNKYSTSNQYIF